MSIRTGHFGCRAILALLVLVCGTFPLAASPWAEVGDNQLRSDVELLQEVGVVDDITTHWPLPWRSLLTDLRRANLSGQPAAVQAAARRVMARAEAGTAQGVSASLLVDATNIPDVVYGFDGMGRGEGQAQLSVSANSGIFSGRISLGGITQNFRGNTLKLMPDGTFMSARLGGALVYAGYLDHWWGPGQISALALSNNARPMPQVGIERSSTQASSWPVLRWLGPWQAEFFLGYLDGPRIQPNTYFNGGRIVIHPLQGLEIGASRTEEFCGDGHPCSPIKDYFHFSNNPDSVNNTNDEAAFDVKYSRQMGDIPFQAYIQLMNEDYSVFNHSGTSHLFGFSAFVPAGAANRVKLTLEYTNTIATHHPFSFGDNIYGFSYNDFQYPDGLRYRGRTLGFSLDDDSTLLSLQGSWTDPDGRFYEMSLYHATIGNSHSVGYNIISPTPVLLNMGEARVTLPWRGLKLDLAGRLQDDQPRPHQGFAASVEVALRAPL